MERLTRRELITIKEEKIAGCNYKNNNCNDSCLYNKCKWQEKANKKLKYYEDLEESLEQIYGECDGLIETAVNTLVKYANTHLEKEIDSIAKARLLTDETVDKWEQWKEADEQGKLMILPVKPGDTVYVPHRGRIQQMEIFAISIGKFGIWFAEWKLKNGEGLYPWLHGFNEVAIGKSVFLTEQAAKEALEKMSNDLISKKITYQDLQNIRNGKDKTKYNRDELSSMIDAAVEKQIPKKPNEHDKKRGMFTCGNCGKVIAYGNSGHLSHKYCLLCGQAIDWTEDNNNK